MALSRMQDIAGVRLVAEMNRTEQDQLVKRIVELFPGADVKDRRAEPSHGYRAVHVIVEVDQRLVEIQVRTVLQDLWAQVVERLADRWGRGIRYGELPNDPDAEVGDGATRRDVIEGLMTQSRVTDMVEQAAVWMAEAEARLVRAEKHLESAPTTPDILELQQDTAETRRMFQEFKSEHQAFEEQVRRFFLALSSLE